MNFEKKRIAQMLKKWAIRRSGRLEYQAPTRLLKPKVT
jgi:hypothetical protein